VPASRSRITGGAFRGLPISEPKGHRLRPTSSRLREAVFNVIAADVEGSTVLDLYAGSGACLTAISQTLDGMKMRDAATLVRGSLPAALERFERTADIAFLDPPYEDQSALQTLGRVGRHLHPEGTVVYEHASRYNPPERPAGLILRQRRVYGDSAIALYALQEGE
jgi:16S rRNA (guanine966-N2)-methyltransferase